jgi:hypothetical protein
MFWAPDRVDASPRCEHAPFLFWLMDTQRPFTLVELTETPAAAYLAFCQAVARLRLPTRCYAISGHGARRSELVGYHDGRYAQFSQILQGRAEQQVDRFDDGAIDLISIDATQSAFADRFGVAAQAVAARSHPAPASTILDQQRALVCGTRCRNATAIRLAGRRPGCARRRQGSAAGLAASVLARCHYAARLECAIFARPVAV